MNIFRIWAIMLRYSFSMFNNIGSIFYLVYWPILNIVIWGMTSSWMQKQSLSPHVLMMMLSGLILWQIVFRVNIEISKSLLDEIMSNNLINLYSTPLTMNEWVVGVLAVGIVQMILVFITSSLVAYFLYSINILSLGFYLIPFILSLLISGWAIGLFICGLLMRYGKKIQDFIYSIVWMFVPFSAIYYPVSTLPTWMQKISYFLPMTYIFEAVRELISSNTILTNYILTSFALNIIYLVGAIIFFIAMFKKSKNNGLLRFD